MYYFILKQVADSQKPSAIQNYFFNAFSTSLPQRSLMEIP